jgi:hypothetical protein
LEPPIGPKSRTEHSGESGLAYWRTRSFGGIRLLRRRATGAKLFIVD